MRDSQPTPIRILALAGLALAAALLSNRLASPGRRLAWSGSAVPLSPASPGPVATPPPEEVTSGFAAQEPGKSHLSPSAPAAPSRKTPPPASAATSTQAPPAFNPIREIGRDEAWEAFQAGTPFLDARRGSEFAEGHVARAWSTPVWEADLEDRLLTFKAARRPGAEDPIVIYCSGGDCRDSHLLAENLLREGYFHLLVFRDGFPAWVAQGHPVEKGRP